MIISTSFFSVSSNVMITQATQARLPFDCQVYLPNDDDGKLGNDLKAQSFIESVEECGYTYLQFETEGKSEYIECLALQDPNSKMVYIPDTKGTGALTITEEGVILARSHANLFNVKAGDFITIAKHAVKVAAISEQLFHPVAFMSIKQLDALQTQYVSTYFVDYTSDVEFAEYLSANHMTSMAVYSSSLQKDLKGRFASVDIFVWILIGFSFLMGIIILSIMAKNALMEQMRQLSVMRAIGFRLIDVSNVLTIQSLSQLFLAAIFAVPAGYGITSWLFKMASSVNQTYPSVFSWPLVLMGFAFVSAIVAISHGISMLTIRKWNLADNTRTRE
jgi:ABC-type antimicrobial peptide transport system permease subunit